MEYITVTINGQQTSVPPGTTIRAAARGLGIHTPALCHATTLPGPSLLHCGSNCRVCSVELEGSRVLVPSCSRPVTAGMQIHTDSEQVRRTRRMLFELLLSEVDVSAASELLAYAAYYGAEPGRFPAPEGPRAKDRPVIVDNPFFVRDYARCIACQRCTQACGDDVQHNFAIAMVGRGHDISVGAGDGANDLTKSPCVFCGNCVGACPTGALLPLPEYELRESDALPVRRLTWSPEGGLAGA